MMYGDEATWFALMNHLVQVSIDCGCSGGSGRRAIQIFDSWVGALNVQDYRLLY